MDSTSLTMSPLWNQFIGGSFQSRSPTLDAEATINLMSVTIDSASNAKKSMLLGTPGLRRLFSVATESCRGMFSQDGRTFAVVGATLYELDLTADTATTLGTVADDELPVSFASNGRGGEQLAICSGGELYVFELDTNTFLGAVTLPLTNAAASVDFIDGYGLVLEKDTVRCWFTALEDFTDVDGLDYFARSQTSDNFVAMKVLRDKVWLFGSQTTELYYDSGDADTPFVPYPGALLREGCAAPWSVTIQGEAIYWLAQDAEGRARFVRAADLDAQPVSTDAIDFALAQAPRLDDTEVLSYWQEGHGFVIWTCPSLSNCGRTFVFDTKEQLWHERASRDTIVSIFYRWRARGVASTDQGVIVGDFETGEIYLLDLNYFSDNGNPIWRVRRTPYLSAENSWLFVDQFELGIQAGVGLNSGQGVDPQVALRVSRDGAMTWGPAITASVGKQGNYLNRAVWRRLGRVRGDRLVIEVSQTDPVRTVWGPGAWLRITQGSDAA